MDAGIPVSFLDEDALTEPETLAQHRVPKQRPQAVLRDQRGVSIRSLTRTHVPVAT